MSLGTLILEVQANRDVVDVARPGFCLAESDRRIAGAGAKVAGKADVTPGRHDT